MRGVTRVQPRQVSWQTLHTRLEQMLAVRACELGAEDFESTGHDLLRLSGGFDGSRPPRRAKTALGTPLYIPHPARDQEVRDEGAAHTRELGDRTQGTGDASTASAT
jgi:hypothetical protein